MKRKPTFYRTIAAVAFAAVAIVGLAFHAPFGNASALGWDVWSAICPVGYIESVG